MGHGGPRPGAGRKSNADIQRARELIAQAVTDADWVAIFAMLGLKALEGNEKAAELLMRYTFGLPTQTVDIENETPLTHISIDM